MFIVAEMETMGFYISGHPLDEYSDRIKNLTPISDIKDRKFSEGKIIKFAGIIRSLRKHTTKKGDQMCFLSVEDRTDAIDVTVFSSAYYDSVSFIYPDSAVVIQGKIEFQSEEVVIRANNLWSAQNYEPDYYLTIPEELENPETYAKLKTILQQHRGQKMVFINKRGKWEKIKSNYWVSYSEQLSTEFNNLLGSNNVRRY